ncbi:hypothetical protein [Sphingomonas sp. ID0503]|uniref:hypothetical protein n=1 Tax=Sphingomonas sp. ID0503 TaxID=3399691 RepID=UPI003AFB3659
MSASKAFTFLNASSYCLWFIASVASATRPLASLGDRMASVSSDRRACCAWLAVAANWATICSAWTLFGSTSSNCWNAT